MMGDRFSHLVKQIEGPLSAEAVNYLHGKPEDVGSIIFLSQDPEALTALRSGQVIPNKIFATSYSVAKNLGLSVTPGQALQYLELSPDIEPLNDPESKINIGIWCLLQYYEALTYYKNLSIWPEYRQYLLQTFTEEDLVIMVSLLNLAEDKLPEHSIINRESFDPLRFPRIRDSGAVDLIGEIAFRRSLDSGQILFAFMYYPDYDDWERPEESIISDSYLQKIEKKTVDELFPEIYAAQKIPGVTF